VVDVVVTVDPSIRTEAAIVAIAVIAAIVVNALGAAINIVMMASICVFKLADAPQCRQAETDHADSPLDFKKGSWIGSRPRKARNDSIASRLPPGARTSLR